MQIFKWSGKKRGFTLVEVMIASTILVVTAIVFLDNLIQCSGLSEAVSLQEIALNAATGMLEEVTHSDSWWDYTWQEFPVSGLTPSAGHTDPLSVEVEHICEGHHGDCDWNSNLYNITVTVDWQERGRAMSRTLTTTWSF